MNLVRQKLESFSVGSFIRMIHAEEDTEDSSRGITYKMTFEDSSYKEDQDLAADSHNYHYLMKDKKYVVVEGEYSPSFRQSLSGYNKDNTLYYDDDNIYIEDGDFIQYNNRCYFLRKNSYENNSKLNWQPYMISQNADYNILSDRSLFNVDNYVSSYISETYSKDYFDMSHVVNNKSVPVYDLDEYALDKISFVKFNDSTGVDRFIDLVKDICKSDSSFNVSSLSATLYDSNIFKFDTNSYDSVSINVMLSLMNGYKIDYKKIFEALFSVLPFQSFLRMFNKRGEFKLNEDFSRYLYSFSLNSKVDPKDISMNYYPLKVLKNPEIYHDYSLANEAEWKSVSPSHYSLTNNAIHDILKLYRKIVEERIRKWIYDNDILNKAESMFSDNDFVDRFINDTVLKYYHLFNYKNVYEKIDSLRKSNVNAMDDSFVNSCFRLYVLQNNGIDLRVTNNIGTYESFKSTFESAIEEFENEAYDYANSNHCNNIVYSVISRISTILNKISLKEFEDVDLSEIPASNVLKDFQNRLKNISTDVDGDNFVEELISSGDFEHGIYKLSIKDIYSKAGAADMDFFNHLTQEQSGLLLEYKIRMNAKINDYMGVYNTMFDHENSFTVNGTLYGNRIYESCYRSCENDLELIYNYSTELDERLFKSLFPDRKIVRKSNLIEGDFSEEYVKKQLLEDEICSEENFTIHSYDDIIAICIALIGGEAELEESENRLKAKFKDGKVSLKMRGRSVKTIVDTLADFQIFYEAASDEVVKFNEDYATSVTVEDNRKVYIFSLRVKMITDNEYMIVNEKRDSNGEYVDWKMKYFEVLNKMKHYQFVDRTDGEFYYQDVLKHKSNIFSLEVKNSGLSESYNDSELDASLKKTIRKAFEDAIRNSIHKYAPAETTLWKVDFVD